MHDVSIVLPWRDSGDHHRQANLARVLDHLTESSLPIVLADDGRESGPFNRSAAYNRGIALSPSNVYVFHEADMLVPFYHLGKAIGDAETGPGLVIPFTQYRYLDAEESRAVLSGLPYEKAVAERTMDNGSAVGAVGVVSAASMAHVGQWDETFMGHGYDDRAMELAFATACGPTRFVDGAGTHLWHPPAYSPWERGTRAADHTNYPEAERRATAANRHRLRLYKMAESAEDVRRLTMGDL